MKVMIVTPYFYPRVGGLENYALNLARGLKKLGHEVFVVTSNHNARKYVEDQVEGLKVIRLPRLLRVSNTPVNPLWFFQLRAIIRRERPDIINAHTPVPFMVDMAALAAGKTPLAITYHAATLFKAGNFFFSLISAAYLPLQALTLRRARSIFAVSDYVKGSLPSRFQLKTLVMPNATHLVSAVSGQHREGLVFVANLEPSHAWKGLDLILETLSIIASVAGTAPKLTVIGDGAHRQYYEQRAKSLNVDRFVTFTGRLVGAERDKTMSRAAALIAYPTTANDAFPTVFLEAWALGLPVIAAAIGSLPSVVEDGKTGILVKPKDAQALARAILKALNQPYLLADMGRNGRSLVLTELNWSVQAKRASNCLELIV